MPFPLVLVVRNRTSTLSPSWPSVKLRSELPPDSVTIPRRAVLLDVGRTHPRLDGDLARAAHGVENLGRRLVGADERLAAYLERAL